MIIRGKSSGSYTIVQNAVINDENIDWRDLGLLVYLLSKPDTWTVSTSQLAAIRKSGVDAIRSSLKSLRNARYVVMKKKHDGAVDWVVFDEPQLSTNTKKNVKPDVQLVDFEPEPEKAKQGKSLTGKKPNRENPALVSTEYITNYGHTDNARVREGSLICENFAVDEVVAARLFSSGVRREVGEFLLDEFVNKNISTGYVSMSWPAEFVSYCKRNEWRVVKHEENQRNSNGGKLTGAAAQKAAVFERIKNL